MFEGSPYRLITSRLKILGREARICFNFAEEELFKIEISGEVEAPSGMRILGGIENAIKEADEVKLKLKKLKDFLTTKYGKPFKEQKSKEKEILSWQDEKGNSLILEISFEPFYYAGKDYLFPSYKVTYSDKKLTELWEKKVAEWEKRRKLLQKGVESF